ncbi:hypothetical protein J7M28_14440 [bacterium]|nr:hypothetical protein [bacterium]
MRGLLKTSAVILLLLALCFSLFSCAASKARRLGEDLEETGRHYEAGLKYIEALDKKPTYKKALLGLARVAEKGYEQKLDLAQGDEENGDFESALLQYKELSNYLAALKKYNSLSFRTVNIREKIAGMSSATAQKYYDKGIKKHNAGDFNRAIGEFRSALSFKAGFKDAHQKIAESFCAWGKKLVKASKYREATKKYILAEKEVPGGNDAATCAAEIFYQMGKYFLEKGYCRNAAMDFRDGQEIKSGYKDIQALISKADECAIDRIGFIRFDNLTHRRASGINMGDFIFDNIKSDIGAKCSRYLRIIERESLDSIVKEQGLGMAGVTDRFESFSTIHGVEYLVFGKINRFQTNHPGLQKNRYKATYTYYYKCKKTDKDGKEYETTCSKDKEMTYTVYRDSISVTVGGSIKAVKVKNGSVAILHQISSSERDSIEYADNFSIDIYASNVGVKSSIKERAEARRNLVSESEMIDKIVKDIAGTMAVKILSTIDTTPHVPDPMSLELDF